MGVAGAALLATAVAVPPQRPTPTRTEVSRGIFLYQTPPYGDVGLDGNSIVITSTDGVLVFDSNGTPAAAAAVLADIRTLTDQPVRYVVNSLWLEQKRGVHHTFPDVTFESAIAISCTRRWRCSGRCCVEARPRARRGSRPISLVTPSCRSYTT